MVEVDARVGLGEMNEALRPGVSVPVLPDPVAEDLEEGVVPIFSRRASRVIAPRSYTEMLKSFAGPPGFPGGGFQNEVDLAGVAY